MLIQLKIMAVCIVARTPDETPNCVCVLQAQQMRPFVARVGEEGAETLRPRHNHRLSSPWTLGYSRPASDRERC